MMNIASYLLAPVSTLVWKRRAMKNNAYVADSPPPIDTPSKWEFGSYCWKVTVEATNEKDGDLDRTFIGYSQNMDIAKRTELACDRHKKSGTTCGELQMSMKGGECDEVIFMKLKNSSKLVRLTYR